VGELADVLDDQLRAWHAGRWCRGQSADADAAGLLSERRSLDRAAYAADRRLQQANDTLATLLGWPREG
jgi:hypothetical protein